MGLKNAITNSHSGGMCGLIARAILRFLQFVLALTVAGLYGVDLNAAHEHGKYADSKWVYAEVVAGLSCFTVIIYGVPMVKSHWFFGWDFILFILWTALFGVFGNMYIGENPEGDSGITRMIHAVWVDLVNMLLWFLTFVYSTVTWWRHRNVRTQHTSRAQV